MRDFMQNFYEVIKFIEDRTAIINDVLSILDFLLHEYDTETLKYLDDEFMTAAIEAERQKLEKY